ncbi:MAG: hypothetical protein ABIX44_08865 [Cryobacterium sp.]
MDEIKFVTEANDDVDLGAIAQEAVEVTEGASLEPDSAQNDFDPLTVAVVVGAVIALVKVVAFVVNFLRGGLEVHLDVTPHTLKRNRDVPVGMVFVFLKDDKIEVQVKDESKDSLERMFEVLFKLPIDATVQMAKDALAAAKAATTGDGDKAEMEGVTPTNT